MGKKHMHRDRIWEDTTLIEKGYGKKTHKQRKDMGRYNIVRERIWKDTKWSEKRYG